MNGDLPVRRRTVADDDDDYEMDRCTSERDRHLTKKAEPQQCCCFSRRWKPLNVSSE